MTASAETSDQPAASRTHPNEPGTIRFVAGALLIALLLRVVLFQPFTIPSSSMEPGLVTGDYMLVSKFSYGWSRASLPFNPPVLEGRLFGRDPERGDVVVFRATDNPSKTLVKRLIGLPGDRVQVTDGVVLLNGRPLPAELRGPGFDRDAPHVAVAEAHERAPGGRGYRTFDRGSGHEGDDTGVYTVPPGHYFMLGDNRDNSLDSRWPPAMGGVGLIPAEYIVGEAQLVLLSWRPGASLFKPWTWLSLAPDRFLVPVR
jgi:signal peptidase I